MDGDHESRLRAVVAGDLPLRGHDRAADGRCASGFLRRAARPRGRPGARAPRRARSVESGAGIRRRATPRARHRVRGAGRPEPVHAYRVIGERAGVVRERGIEGLSSPLVGRDAEMHTLRGAFIELRRGRGQIVSVMGEAGLGKSRLGAEFRASPTPLAGVKVKLRWLEGRSVSYETSTPSAPFADLLGGLFHVQFEHTDEEKYRLIQKKLVEIAPDRVTETAPFMASLLGVEVTGEDAERGRYLEPPQLRSRVFEAVIEVIERLAGQAPLVLVFEDLHWVDPTSLDLIEQLMLLTERAEVMILALFRPRRHEPSWRFHEAAARDYAHRYTSIAPHP